MSARPAPLPALTSHADLMDMIATRLPCDDAPAGYKPPDGWHTISVGTVANPDPDPGSLRAWMRLFDLYVANRKGRLYWKDVPHLDREKREIAATFCIDWRKSK